MQSAVRARRRLTGALVRAGALTDPAWIEAFQQVPRHPFVPRFFLAEMAGWVAVDSSDPGWLRAVYSDQVLVTQLDEDPGAWRTARRTGPVAGVPTCSSSMPSIMAIMLEELLVRAGHQVLEVGTGTGYNAALLSYRLGSGQVSTIDIDGDLVEQARIRLGSCGYRPRCEVRDGAGGFPEQAPFDRVLCTCSVSTIPPEWLNQTKPGGFVLTTLNRPIGAGLVRLTVGEDGTGCGQVLARDGRFMPLRAHRRSEPGRLLSKIQPNGAAPRPTPLSVRSTLNPASRFEFFAGLALPEVAPAFDPAAPDATFLVHADGSWARHFTDHDRNLVSQGGPRRLWDLLESAYSDWQDLGEPTRDRFGVTVTQDRQELWLDEPTSKYVWPL
ncbi:methyltransferase domain-containing protein [Amycolatopsis acidicola]|uniref:Protein-L-isoaspartate O-methyltransferase n=1 Tax=Amycolatopsis acidicola TaxID=2596893 RepID=A0A5N0VFL6_9PSEU|nr:ATP-grasp peptide maturase system methyltransferase [Amycolatopsis acidicola]KAA9164905.1 methyltransferase domain-containing protein [Amycolatopsis acidicola]